jgi:hypothetical protein
VLALFPCCFSFFAFPFFAHLVAVPPSFTYLVPSCFLVLFCFLARTVLARSLGLERILERDIGPD